MPYLSHTDATARSLMANARPGPVVMVNLLRFRPVADYCDAPGLAPPAPITGARAYALYTAAILPLLTASGGKVLLDGAAHGWFIGPEDQSWDRVLIVQQSSLQAFFGFATDPAAQTVQGHRTAALADSRLLPAWPDAHGSPDALA